MQRVEDRTRPPLRVVDKVELSELRVRNLERAVDNVGGPEDEEGPVLVRVARLDHVGHPLGKVVVLVDAGLPAGLVLLGAARAVHLVDRRLAWRRELIGPQRQIASRATRMSLAQ